MKISVIIACKNEKDTISQTLDSILSQTYGDFEIVVVDGNSTDGTLDILASYDEKIRLILGQEKGIYPAMNEGIGAVTGEILYFLNANDFLFSNDVFEKVIKAFSDNDCDIIYGDTNFQTKNEDGTLKNTYISHKNFYSKFVWAYRNINHQSTFYKKWLFDKYGKYNGNDFKILADVEFTTHVVTQKEVKHLYLPILVANYNAEGVSSYENPQNILRAREEKELIAKKYLNFEHNLFMIYNIFFMNAITIKFNNFLKEKFGLGLIFKIRDLKRSLGRILIWWTRRI